MQTSRWHIAQATIPSVQHLRFAEPCDGLLVNLVLDRRFLLQLDAACQHMLDERPHVLQVRVSRQPCQPPLVTRRQRLCPMGVGFQRFHIHAIWSESRRHHPPHLREDVQPAIIQVCPHGQ